MGINSIDLKVVKDLFCQIPILSAAEESLLCDYPMVTDYILEINLTKRQSIENEPGHDKMCLMSYANNKAQIRLRIRAI